jgi:hypothetical protein
MTTQGAVGARSLERRAVRDRRVKTTRVRLPERRRGFDRRIDPSVGTRRVAYRRLVRRISDSPRQAAMVMASIVALNVADIAFTFHALDRGLEELNPVMVGLLDAGRWVAAVVKIGVTGLVAAVGWRFRRYRRVIDGALFVLAVMSVLSLYHLLNLAAM